jgi:hypothetical protein
VKVIFLLAASALRPTKDPSSTPVSDVKLRDPRHLLTTGIRTEGILVVRIVCVVIDEEV